MFRHCVICLGDQRLAYFRNHLHHLELKVIHSVVQQPSHNAYSHWRHIVKVQSHRFKHIRFAILLKWSPKVNVCKWPYREHYFLLVLVLLYLLLFNVDRVINAFNITHIFDLHLIKVSRLSDHKLSGSQKMLIVAIWILDFADQQEE